MDQSNIISIRKFINKNSKKKFNIIIDDGSHKQSDILLTFNEFFKTLSAGSFYIIEDISYENQPMVLSIYDHFKNNKIVKLDYLDQVEFNKIKNISRIESQQNYYNKNDDKSTQQYILFIEVY